MWWHYILMIIYDTLSYRYSYLIYTNNTVWSVDILCNVPLRTLKLLITRDHVFQNSWNSLTFLRAENNCLIQYYRVGLCADSKTTCRAFCPLVSFFLTHPPSQPANHPVDCPVRGWRASTRKRAVVTQLPTMTRTKDSTHILSDSQINETL